MKKLISSVIALLAVVLPQGAIAQNVLFGSIHKWTDTATGKVYVYVPETLAAAAVAALTTAKAPVARSLTLDNCGWGKFTKSTISPPLIITGADWAGKTNGAAPTCTKDPAPALTYTSSNPAPTGAVIDTGTQIWIRGGTGPGTLAINITALGKINAKPNACGFVRIAISTSRPMNEFTIGTTNFALSQVPSVPAPIICRKVGTTNETYVPIN